MLGHGVCVKDRMLGLPERGGDRQKRARLEEEAEGPQQGEKRGRGADAVEDESTESEEAEARGGMLLARRAARRKRRLDQHHLRNREFPQLSLLEAESVGPRTLETYKAVAKEF